MITNFCTLVASKGVAAVLIAWSLAACTADRPVLPLHPTPSARPSPGAATPSTDAMGAGARAAETTAPDQIEQAVQTWIGAANKAFASGDALDLRRLTRPECECTVIADRAQRWWHDGSVEGLHWTLHSIHVVDIGAGLADVEFQYDEPTFWVVSHGKQSPHHLADRVTILAQLQLIDGVWQLRRYFRGKAVRI